jgi:hypothetical protein
MSMITLRDAIDDLERRLAGASFADRVRLAAQEEDDEDDLYGEDDLGFDDVDEDERDEDDLDELDDDLEDDDDLDETDLEDAL